MPDLGWVAGFHEEARVLNPILLREGWRDWLAASAGGTAEQLLDFELGDGMDRGGLGVLPEALPAQGMPAAAAAISAT